MTDVCIASAGARTPLGLRAAQSAAAVRAGISALGEHPRWIDRAGNPMRGALDSRLMVNTTCVQRLLVLAESALREACLPLRDAPALAPIRVSLALPEPRPGFTAAHADAVRDGLRRVKSLPVAIGEVIAFAQGHAAGLAAVCTAADDIRHGRADLYLVGGADSYFNVDTMEWLDANRQLAGAVSRSGFVPGEAAGFCLLMSERACQRLNIRPLARVVSAAIGRETVPIKTDDICLGHGLTSVIREALSAADARSGVVNGVICDINGERYRGEEWGFVALRLGEFFDDPMAYQSPADCWGDVGAASGPLFVMLTCQAAIRGYTKGPISLLWGSSESGLRSSIVLESTNAASGE